LWHSYRLRSVAGLSLPWAIMNFTAAFNNVFFVFKLPTRLPIYSYCSGIYLSVLTGLLLVLFYVFTEHTRKKVEALFHPWIICSIQILIYCSCAVVWVILVGVQVFFDVYQYMEWVSIGLWSIETFPQVGHSDGHM
jgi:hypothetical protein